MLGSLGAPAFASLMALVTMGAPPNETGRVLAGLSVLESLAVALRNPVFFPLFQATLERAPGAIWWLAAVSCEGMRVNAMLILFVTRQSMRCAMCSWSPYVRGNTFIRPLLVLNTFVMLYIVFMSFSRKPMLSGKRKGTPARSIKSM